MSPVSSPREQQCAICLHHPVDPATIKSCGHSFCLTCLRQWAASRREPKCPLCQAEMAVLCHAGGEETVTPPEPAPEEGPPDLGCLDHSYFKLEASRLLQRARTVQHGLTASSYGCGRRGSSAADDATAAVHQVIDSLCQIYEDMEQEIPFCAEDVLQELYALDSVVSAAQDGSLFGAQQQPQTRAGGRGMTSFSDGGQRQRLSAADAAGYDNFSADIEAWSEEGEYYEEHEEEEEEEEDEHDDDDLLAWHAERLGRMSLHATPGGRPSAGKSRGGTTNSNGGNGMSMISPAASTGSLGSSKR